MGVVLTSDGGGGWVVMVGWCWVDGGICVLVVLLLQVLCVCVGVFVWVFVCIKGRRWTSSDLLKGNLVIAHRVQQIVDSTRMGFFQNGPLSSFPILRVLFTNPKRNFFQKVTFWSQPNGLWTLAFFKTNFLG